VGGNVTTSTVGGSDGDPVGGKVGGKVGGRVVVPVQKKRWSLVPKSPDPEKILSFPRNPWKDPPLSVRSPTESLMVSQ